MSPTERSTRSTSERRGHSESRINTQHQPRVFKGWTPETQGREHELHSAPNGSRVSAMLGQPERPDVRGEGARTNEKSVEAKPVGETFVVSQIDRYSSRAPTGDNGFPRERRSATKLSLEGIQTALGIHQLLASRARSR